VRYPLWIGFFRVNLEERGVGFDIIKYAELIIGSVLSFVFPLPSIIMSEDICVLVLC